MGSPPNPPRSGRGYLVIPVAGLASVLGGSVGWAGRGYLAPQAQAVESRPAPPAPCPDEMEQLRGRVGVLERDAHDRAQREQTLEEVDKRLRGVGSGRVPR